MVERWPKKFLTEKYRVKVWNDTGQPAHVLQVSFSYLGEIGTPKPQKIETELKNAEKWIKFKSTVLWMWRTRAIS